MLGDSAMTWGAQSGRTTPQGLQVLRAGLRELTPQAVVISLGTNDGPDPLRFADRLRRVMAAVPASACVVWTNVNRPPRKGAYAGINRVLWRAAARNPRLVIVDWDWAVAQGKVQLPDGLHPDAAGYQYRSQMIATAMTRRCPAALAS
jgi:lysophospholipase L1-like esterase